MRHDPRDWPPTAVGQHAADRFAERWGGTIAELQALLPRARFHAAEPGNDQSFWIVTRGDAMVVLVVDDTGIVRTVLPRGTVPR